MTNEMIDEDTGKLLPCPFCGENWYVYMIEPDEGESDWTVGCLAQMEGGCGFSSDYTTKEHAIAAWNRRAK